MVFVQSDLSRSNLASRSVASAFVLSLLLHLFVVLAIELGHQTGLWKRSLIFARQPTDAELRTAQEQAQQPQEQEMPLIFVEVDPAVASSEPPKEAKYYSALSSRAANPDTSQDRLIPKVDGEQEHVPQTVNKGEREPEPAPAPQPLTAAPPAEAPPPAPTIPEPPRPAPLENPRPSDVALAKPLDRPRQPAIPRTTPPPTQSSARPRTLEAARRQKGVPGERVKQQGGVRRFSLESRFDVRATPFGAYDAAIIAAIEKRWHDLLATRDFAANYAGKVVLEFRLNSDGQVSDMRVTENGVTEILGLLCQRAVQDPSPFAPWPADLRRLVGREFRDVRFTFYYN